MTMPKASIIIATYNRAHLLDRCLEALGRQAFEPGDEVIIVDNGSTDHTAAIIARHSRSFPVLVRRLEERRPGKSHALATASRVAGGDIWVFTDDDVVVAPTWLAVIRETFEDSAVALAGGPVAPQWEQPAPRWLRRGVKNDRLWAPLALIDYGPTACELGERTLLGANMAIRRDVMRQVGGFSTALGKLRGTLRSGEDDDLCQRVQAAGFCAWYVPRAIVHHSVPSHRMRLRYYLAWFYWSGVTLALLDSHGPQASRQVLGLPGYLVRRAATSLAGFPLAALAGGAGEAVERILDVAFTIGYAAQRWGLVDDEGATPPATPESPGGDHHEMDISAGALNRESGHTTPP